MVSTYIGKKGALRIYESTDTARALANVNVEEFDSSGASYNDVTSAAHSAAGSLTGAIAFDSGDYLYVGATERFARINVDVDTAAVGAGALTVEYYNGSSWAAVTELSDGTESGSNTLAQDGVISFKIPPDWALQGVASIDADKYYVRLSTASAPSTDPNFEQVVPVDGLYYEVKFVQVDLRSPEGRARPDEIPQLDRSNLDANFHYVAGSDQPVVEPLEFSFTCRLVDDINASSKHELFQALQCLDPEVSTWNGTGTSTKGDTSLVAGDGTSVATPAFRDAAAKHKTVAVQAVWESLADADLKVGREFNEVWFDLSRQELSESEDGLMLSLTGLCYGPIRAIWAFGYQH